MKKTWEEIQRSVLNDLRDRCLRTGRSADDLLGLPPRDPELDRDDDLAKIFYALGLGSHTRSKSPHEVVVDEVLPAIKRLVAGEQEQLSRQSEPGAAEADAQKSEEGGGGVAAPRFDPSELYEWAYAFHRDRECSSSACHDRAVEFVNAAAGRLA